MTPTNLDTLLDKLQDEDRRIPDEDYAFLSDLDLSRYEQFVRTWEMLSPNRRRGIIQKLGELATENIELSYDRINCFAMKDTDPSVRRMAIINLWEFDDIKVAPDLVDALSHDPDPDVRAAAADALGKFMLIGELSDTSTVLRREVENALLYALENETIPEIQQNCIKSLGYSSSETVHPILSTAYVSNDEGLKLAAVIAMGRSVNKQWTELIIEEMDNPSPLIRAEAARAAGEIEARTSIDALIELLEDIDPSVRINAIWSLGQIGGDRAEQALENIDPTLEDDEVSNVLDEAMDHLAFVNETRDFLLFDVDDPGDAD